MTSLTAVIALHDAVALAAFVMILTIASPLLRTSGLGSRVSVLVIANALLSLVDAPVLHVISSFLFAFARVATLNILIRWYGESIHYSQLYAVVGGSRFGREEMFFIIYTLTAYPLIARDLRLALDAERLRLGHWPRFWQIGTWLNVLTNVLVRSLERVRSSADSMVERGFALDQRFTVAQTRTRSSLTWPLMIGTLLLFLPPLTILLGALLL